MTKKHLKRLLVPRFWKIGRKEKKFAVKPRPGPHPARSSIPLQVIVRDLLKIVGSGREAKQVVKQRAVLVDGKVRTDHKYAAGLMDVVELPKLKLTYRVVPTKKGLELLAISKNEAKKKLCKIENKTTVRGGIVQLNTHDGRSVRVGKGESKKYKECKTGDSLLIELPSQKIVSHIKMDKGSLAVVTRGKNIGKFVKIVEMLPARAMCKSDKEKIEVLKTHMFVVGRAKPLIKLSE